MTVAAKGYRPPESHTCSITLINLVTETLYFDTSITSRKGVWVPGKEPPATIAPGDTAAFQMATPAGDGGGVYGAVGYRIGSATGPLLDIAFQCPDTHSNRAGYTASADLAPFALPYKATASGKTTWNTCPANGAPLSLDFALVPRLTTLALTGTGSAPVLDCSGTAYPGPTLWSAPGGGRAGTSGIPALLTAPPLSAKDALMAQVVPDCNLDGTITLTGRWTGPDGLCTLSGTARADGTGSGLTVPLAVTGWPKGTPVVGAIDTAKDGGDVLWTLGGSSVTVAQTPLELYFIAAAPQAMWPDGVWIQVLRDLFAALSDPTSETQVIADIVTACFRGLSTCPDGRCGLSAQTHNYQVPRSYWDPGHFPLSRYYASSNGVNCSDQTYLLLLALGALGFAGVTYSFTFIGDGTVQGSLKNPDGDVVTPGVPATSATKGVMNGHDLAGLASTKTPLDACFGPYGKANGTAQDYIGTVFQPGVVGQPISDPNDPQATPWIVSL